VTADRLDAYRDAVAARAASVEDDVAEGERLAEAGPDERPVCERCDRHADRLETVGWSGPAVCRLCEAELHGVEPAEVVEP